MTQLSDTASLEELGRRPGRWQELLRAASWDVEDLAAILRWGAVVMAVIGASARAGGLASRHEAEAAVVVVVTSLLRSFGPVRSAQRSAPAGAVSAAEVGLLALAASLSGGWGSPYMLCIGCSLVATGLVHGLWPMLSGMAGFALFVCLRTLPGQGSLGATEVAYRALELAATGLVGVTAGHVFRAQKARAGGLASLRSAREVNSLLLGLHARTADEPWSLSLSGVVGNLAATLRAELPGDVTALLLRDQTTERGDEQWQVAYAEGAHLCPVMADSRLPGALRRARRGRETLRVALLDGGEGLDGRSGSGIYAAVWAGSALIGLVAVERRERHGFSEGDLVLLEQIACHAGLAIDNTRWFARLRRMGAEIERDRIARELHDRVGQSLAGVGLTVDRLALTLPGGADEVRVELEELAEEVRAVTRHIREKLTDLRTGPSPRLDLSEVLSDFLARVKARSGIAVELHAEPGPRLAEAEEHEIWRIAQEAVLNAERHAGAGRIEVQWRYESGAPTLVVRDDGKGIAMAAPIRRDAYGLLGMRERAEAIGATLAIESAPGAGTTVRLRLGAVRR